MTAKSELYDVVRAVLDAENHPFAHDTTKVLVEAIVDADLLAGVTRQEPTPPA